MFQQQTETGYRTLLEGIEMRPLVYGDRMLLAEFRLRQGCTLPRHAHPHEQAGYLVRGRVRLSVGPDEYEARPGDSWCIPGGVEHGAFVVEDAVITEAFSPVREDYLP